MTDPNSTWSTGDKGCPPLPDLLEYAEDPVGKANLLAGYENHLDQCDFCAQQLEIAARRHWRKGPAAVLRSFAPLLPVHGVPVVVGAGTTSAPEHVPSAASPWYRFLQTAAALPLQLHWQTAAAFLLVVLLGAAGGAAGVTWYFDPVALLQRNADLEKRLAEAGVGTPVGDQTPDTRHWEFEYSRKVELLLNHQGKRGLLGIKFRFLPGPPYYTGLDVIWDAEQKPPSKPVEVYTEGHLPLNPLLTHLYELPAAGSKRVTVRLVFYTSGTAIKEFDAPELVIESIPLVLTPDGVRVASVGSADAVTVQLEEPAHGTSVEENFRLSFRVRTAPRATKAAGGAGPIPGALHILIRPLDGDPGLGDRCWVQAFRQNLADLPVSASGNQHAFSTWVTLKGILNQVPPSGQVPTRFEVLIVELPVRLAQPEVARNLLGLHGPQLPDIVKASLGVNLRPSSQLN